MGALFTLVMVAFCVGIGVLAIRFSPPNKTTRALAAHVHTDPAAHEDNDDSRRA